MLARPEPQRLLAELELHGPCLTRLEPHALEIAQLEHRAHTARGDVVDIELHNLGTRDLRLVGHVNAHSELLAGMKRIRRETQALIARRVVRKAVPEGEECLVRRVHVAGDEATAVRGALGGTARAELRVVERLLAHVVREAHSETTRGVHVAEKHVGDGTAGGGAGEPRLEHGVAVVEQVGEGERAPVEKHEHDGLAKLTHALEEALLRRGQRDVGPRAALPALQHVLAKGHHDDVGACGGLERLGLERGAVELLAVRHGAQARARADVLAELAELGVVVKRLAAPCPREALGPEDLLESLVQRDGVRLVGMDRPHADDVLAVRVGPDKRDARPALARVERQDAALVLEQHERLAAGLSRALQALGRARDLRAAGRRAGAVRVLEEPEPVLELEHAQAGGVHLLRSDLPVRDEPLELVRVAGRLHVDVHGGVHGEARGLALIRRDAVRHELGHGGVVGDDRPREAPLAAQHVVHQPFVGRGGNAVDRVEARHDEVAAGVDGRLVRRKVLVAQAPLAHVDRVVLAAGLGRAVAGEVLHTARNRALGRAVAVQALDHRTGEAAGETRVLARHLEAAAPAGVADHVDGRAEGDHTAIGHGLLGDQRVILAN